jgi:hypothetical protein
MDIKPDVVVRAQNLVVYLDGVVTKDVVRANSETGEVEVFVRDEHGAIVVKDNSVCTETKRGTVRYGIKEIG